MVIGNLDMVRLLSFILSHLIIGCASHSVMIRPGHDNLPLCATKSGLMRTPTWVFWRTQWRSNQKDVRLRERAAQQGIESYFAHSRCYQMVALQRTESGQDLAMDIKPNGRMRIWIVIKELGPWVKIFHSPWLLEGGTEVLLEVAVQPANSRNAPATAEIRSIQGGPWVIMGVKNLPEDLRTALAALFEID